MGKRRYLVGFNIKNDLAKERIMNDPDLANLVTGNNEDEMVIIKGGLKAKEVLNMAQFLSSALTITCCRIDGDALTNNTEFNEDIRYCMHDLMGYAEEFDDMGEASTKGFKRWFKDCIVKCQYNRYIQGYNDFDENIVRVYPVDITELDEVAMFFGYDVVKKDDGEDNE